MKIRKLKSINSTLKNYGIVGDVSTFIYKGQPLQVGDTVEYIYSNNSAGVDFIAADEDGYFLMGLKNRTLNKKTLGSKTLKVLGVKKFYETKTGDKVGSLTVIEEAYKTSKIITIDGKDIEISEESFEELKKQLLD